jgi:hypothetical protein
VYIYGWQCCYQRLQVTNHLCLAPPLSCFTDLSCFFVPFQLYKINEYNNVVTVYIYTVYTGMMVFEYRINARDVPGTIDTYTLTLSMLEHCTWNSIFE